MITSVLVSMYNVGFGDCFLLRFAGPDREHKMLIDCGSIKKGKDGDTDVEIDEVVDRIIEDVRDDNDVARIDVVAMTHRHKDHVSGFSKDAWDEVEVDEVWMPWTEDPDDPEAQRLLNEMSSFALALHEEYKALAARGNLNAAESSLIEHVLENTLDLSMRTHDDLAQLDAMGLTNESAMATLHRGFAGGSQGPTRRFLKRSRPSRPRRPIPGVDIHVLAPSDDESVIADMDPPATESFLRIATGTSELGETLPFAGEAFPNPADVPGISPALAELLVRISNGSAMLAAAALEKAVNNTSLFLAIEVGEAVLLFPGDSQWGSWKLNLDDPQRLDLMRRTRFYKVGHHGSHNANPRTFIEDEHLTDLWCAATSVTPHGRFTKIPEPDLLAELAARFADAGDGVAGVVRSDEPPPAATSPGGVVVVDGMRIDFEVPID